MERSFLKGLMKAAGVSHQEDLKVLVVLLPPAAGGARGWMKDWAFAAIALRDKEKNELAWAEAQAKAKAKAEAKTKAEAEPRWGIRYVYGSYSFSNELYDIVVEEVNLGEGVAFPEAQAEAEAAKARHAKRIDRANADWHDFINF